MPLFIDAGGVVGRGRKGVPLGLNPIVLAGPLKGNWAVNNEGTFQCLRANDKIL